MTYQKELLKGNTESLLLALLATESMYGYQLVKEIDRRSSGYFQFKEGTLYPALHRLERAMLIKGTWRGSPIGQQRRYYFITQKGTGELLRKTGEWRDFSRAVDLVMKPYPEIAR